MTPHRWTLAEPVPSVEVVGSKRCPAESGGVGAGGYELVHLRLRDAGTKLLTFVLKTPWEREPAEVRRLVITRSH